MNMQTINDDSVTIETGRYFTIQKDGYKVFIVTFDSEEEMDSYIEGVCVSMGEDGNKDNFLYQSNQKE